MLSSAIRQYWKKGLNIFWMEKAHTKGDCKSLTDICPEKTKLKGDIIIEDVT